MGKPLTALSVRNAKPGKVRREIPDPGCRGLYLVLQPAGAKSWAYRYRFNGRPKKLTIGPVYLGKDEPDQVALDQPCSLAGARKLAGEAALQVAKGQDPSRHKKRERESALQRAANAELLDRDTVEAVARLFIEKHARPKNRLASWIETARVIGLRPDPADPSKLIRTKSGGEVLSGWDGKTVHEISRRDVLTLLDRIVSRGSPVMANRALSAVRKMFSWAASRDIITDSPCDGVSPPAAENARDRVLSDEELRLVWRGTESLGWPFGHLFRLLLLTLQRKHEVGGMYRSELQLADKLWVIPRQRVKNNKEHDVSLSAAAISLIEQFPIIGKAGIVFTVTGDAPVSGFSKAKYRLDVEIVKLQKADAEARGENPKKVKPIPHWTLHDLRRTGASGMARLGINLPVIEKVLNHTSGSFRGVVGVYQRHSFADEKRKAMEAWGSFVASTVESKLPANVVHMPIQQGVAS